MCEEKDNQKTEVNRNLILIIKLKGKRKRETDRNKKSGRTGQVAWKKKKTTQSN